MTDINTHYLLPGNVFTSQDPFLVTTILGSCVAVCLWEPSLRIGGINHYLLPLWNGEGLPLPRFGNVAIKKLIEKMEALGALKSNLKAKVFGGSSINLDENGLLNIGGRNTMTAKDILAEERIPILCSDTGGKVGRKLLFHTDTGLVKIRKLVKKDR